MRALAVLAVLALAGGCSALRGAVGPEHAADRAAIAAELGDVRREVARVAEESGSGVSVGALAAAVASALLGAGVVVVRRNGSR